MRLASSTNLARAFMCSADDVSNTSAAFDGPFEMAVQSVEGRRQRLFPEPSAVKIGVGLELRKIGVPPKHAIAILQHKGAEIAAKSTEWLVVNSVGGADTSASAESLCALLGAYVREGAPAFNVLHIPSIKMRVDRAIRLTQADIGVDPNDLPPKLSQAEIKAKFDEDAKRRKKERLKKERSK